MILTILKIIGIILLSIIGIILLLLLSVLFVPIRYKITGDNLTSNYAKASVTWLLGLIRLGAVVTDKFYIVQFYILCFPIFRLKDGEVLKRNKKEKNKRTKKEVTKEKKSKEIPIKEVAKERKTEENDKTESPVSVENDKMESPVSAENSNKEPLVFNEDFGESRKKPSFIRKIINFLKQIPVKIRNFKFKIQHICDKIKNVKDTIKNCREFLALEETKECLRLMKEQLKRLFRHIKPRKWNVFVHFGMNDPATTGQIFGTACLFYKRFGNHVVVQPDFEKSILEGSFYAKGRIQIFYLLLIAKSLYKSEALIHTLQKIRSQRRRKK